MVVQELIAKFGLQPDKRSFQQAENRTNKLIDGAKRLAAAFAGISAVRGLFGGLDRLAEAGDQIAKTSARLGVGAQQLQAWRFAAERSGVQARTFDIALQRFQRRTAEAARGTGEAKDTIAQLGLQLKDANGNLRASPDLMLEVADKLSSVESASERTRIAFKLFDSEGVRLLQLLQEGGPAVEGLLEQFRDLGGGMDAALLKNAEEYQDNLSNMRIASLGLASRLGNTLLPIVTRGIGIFTGLFSTFQRLTKGSKIVQIALATLGTISAVAAVRAVVPWLPLLGTFAGLAALVLGFIAIVDDLHAMLTGGESLIGKYIDRWLGIGTVDRMVRQWHQGVQILSESIRDLWDGTKGFFDFLISGEILSWLKDFATDTDTVLETWDKLVSLWDGAGELLSTIFNAVTDPQEIPEPPRAAGRGLDADIVGRRVNRGQASASAVAGMSEAAFRRQQINQQMSFHVDARGSTNPQETRRQVEKGVRQGLRREAAQARDALARRASE